MENTLLQNDLVEQREGFKIENLEGATWAFRKLRAIENKEAEVQEQSIKFDSLPKINAERIIITGYK